MDFERWERALQWLLAGLMGLWAAIPELTQLLLALMAIDVVMGIVVAAQQGKVRPSTAWVGITRKFGSLGIVVLGALLDPHVNKVMTIDLVQASSAFYIVPELASILRNAAILGIPVPEQLKMAMDYFKNVSGGGKRP